METETMDLDGPLDFESEDLLLKTSAPTKRRNVIGLDDLVNDFLKDNKKQMKSKKAKATKSYLSDEDEDIREARLSECVEKCQKEMRELSGEDEIHLWGLNVFGNQKTQPVLEFQKLGSCGLLESFMCNALNSLVELDMEKGEVFLERLLVNGWLLKLVFTSGHVEKSIAMWTFGLMLYSSDEVVISSACEFWTAILSPKRKIEIEWLPNLSAVKKALEIYGFILDMPPKFSKSTETDNADSDFGALPKSIRAWIKSVAACFQARSAHSIFLTSEVEELLVVIICLFLDRRLLGLSTILHECVLSAINFFTDEEWNSSCEKVASSLACSVPRDVNCLRIVESISGVDARSKHLRRAVAFQILVACFSDKASDAEEILRSLISLNVKDKSCDLFKMYIYLVLTENWLLSNPLLEERSVICEMWGVYLRNCSCQISSMDLRSYASKVRSKASYLLQGTNK
ncbi:hypothetical protein NMG60_11015633 [Bertholletia excelsa]